MNRDWWFGVLLALAAGVSADFDARFLTVFFGLTALGYFMQSAASSGQMKVASKPEAPSV